MRSLILFLSLVLCLLSYHETQGAEPGPRDFESENAGNPDDTRRRIVDALRDQNSKLEESNTELLGQIGFPNHCYSCVDCPVITNDTAVKMCPYQNSKCVKYAESYSYAENPIYIRGCVLDRGSCKDIENVHGEHHAQIRLVSCDECEGDRCNGSTKSDLTAAVIFLIITPLVTKYTFS